MFLPLLETVKEAKGRESKDLLVLEAYNAWQVIETLKAILGEKKPLPFGDYLKILKLEESPPLDKEQAQLLKATAIQKAEQIKQLFKKEAGL